MNEDNVETETFELGCLTAMVILLTKIVLPFVALIAIFGWLLK